MQPSVSSRALLFCKVLLHYSHYSIRTYVSGRRGYSIVIPLVGFNPFLSHCAVIAVLKMPRYRGLDTKATLPPRL
ncbi:hypothetical protein F5Y00DRAFT_229868 [Daldinia vernicosa]|uniref:uncharacterized protein n=1 Tax=Daldinia vernicosa TaxID=114800 RepID=UPI0020075F7B|nr:uncharacterized protein F5Y00DRAFT_229868 [Daldinia vernicosa]KAI0851497.1 hypothetical protein F5Y00DRAFT_229868 [Daldinia vernicosa]